MKVQDIKEFKEAQKHKLSLDRGAPLSEAVKNMAGNDYGAVAALKDGKYDGLFTERMLLKNIVAKGRKIDGLKLKDVAAHNAPTTTLEEDAQEVMNTLAGSAYRHMPVLDKDKRFVGMLSQGDFAVYTWSQALGRTTEAAQIGVTSAYQPFMIIAALVLYTLFVVYLAATVFHTGNFWF